MMFDAADDDEMAMLMDFSHPTSQRMNDDLRIQRAFSPFCLLTKHQSDSNDDERKFDLQKFDEISWKLRFAACAA